MDITTTFRVVYNPDKDGTLPQFRAKFTKKRDHILAMQAKGLIPSGGPYWVPSTLKTAPPTEGPDAPSGGAAGVLPFLSQRIHPGVLHMPGTRLDVSRLAA